MKEFKGTKGPWVAKNKAQVEGDLHLLFAGVNSKGEGYLVGGICVWDDDKNTKEEALHNANLIAAAPDLLEALQEMVAIVRKNTYPQPDKPSSTWGRMEAAELAIAKALGETK